MTYQELRKKYEFSAEAIKIAHYLKGWQKQKLTISVQDGSWDNRNWVSFYRFGNSHGQRREIR